MFTKLLISLLIPQLSLTIISNGLVKGITTHHKTPGWQKINQLTIEPIISAPAAAVIDVGSGQILFKKNPNEQRPIASITKIFTAYAYLKKTNYDLARLIALLKADEKNAGRRNIYRGEIGTAQDYLNISLIASDNSAITALARAGNFLDQYSSESDFLLTEIGLKDTHLQEPTGLSAQNISTALEVARLTRIIFQEKEIAEITIQPTYTFSPINSRRERIIQTTNELLSTNLFKIVAGKTGHTEEAGYCLVIKATNEAGKEIIISVLGASSSEERFQDAKSLAWWVFKNFN